MSALLPVRPRWLPRFLWRRIPTRVATWTLTARPEWIYPYSTVPPQLGRPVQFLTQETARPHTIGWREQ